jgi:hypothetical protein
VLPGKPKGGGDAPLSVNTQTSPSRVSVVLLGWYAVTVSPPQALVVDRRRGRRRHVSLLLAKGVAVAVPAIAAAAYKRLAPGTVGSAGSGGEERVVSGVNPDGVVPAR